MRIFLLVALLVFSSGVSANYHPKPAPGPHPEVHNYNGNATQATAEIVEFKMGKMGFAANDPKYQSTKHAVFGGISSAALTAATYVAVGGVAAISWPAVLVALGGGAIIGAVFPLWDSAVDRFFVGEDGQIVLQQGPLSIDYNGDAWVYFDNRTDSYFPDIYAAIQDLNSTAPTNGSYERDYSQPSGYCYYYSGEQIACSQIGNPVSPGDYRYFREDHIGVHEIGDYISPDRLDMGVSPQLLAEMANEAWRNASMDPDADIVPWSPSNPITAQDVMDWSSTSPSPYPTIRDLVSPVAPPGHDTVPVPDPGVNPNPNPNPDPDPDPWPNPDPDPDPNPNPDPELDLGPDPEIGAPDLEPIPTAYMILEPLMGVMPDLKNYSPERQAGECPRPEFEVLGEPYMISAHCDLIDQNAGTIMTAMLAMYSLIALLIILRA